MKYTALNDSLYRYINECRTGADDPVLDDLRRETQALGEISRMQISEVQGTFMTILTAAIGARAAIETGTFTGYSSICIARGLPENGRLICIDESETWTNIARRYWARASVAGKIELRLGAAVPILQQLDANLRLDLAFIDAAKVEYDAYYELILPRIRPGGVILFDNMLWGGRLGGSHINEPDGKAIDSLNRKLATDSRVDTVLLPIADGLQFCRKR